MSFILFFPHSCYITPKNVARDLCGKAQADVSI